MEKKNGNYYNGAIWGYIYIYMYFEVGGLKLEVAGSGFKDLGPTASISCEGQCAEPQIYLCTSHCSMLETVSFDIWARAVRIW